MNSPPRWSKRPYKGPLEREILRDSVVHIQRLLEKEMGAGLVSAKETAHVELEIDGEEDRANNILGVHVTLYVRKEKSSGWWLFSEKNTVRRKVVRVTVFFFCDLRCGVLRCELFLANKIVYDVAQRVLEPLAKGMGYSGVEYVSMSHDRSACYPGERRELPVAVVKNGK